MKEVGLIRRYNFWDWLAWVAFAYVVLYLLLRVLGVLHSPQLIDLGWIVSLGYFAGRYAQKIDRLVDDVEDLKYVVEEHITDRGIHK